MECKIYFSKYFFRNDDHQSLLSLLYNNYPLFKKLVYKSDIDLNVENEEGFTPLHAVVEFGDFELVKFLLETRKMNIQMNQRTKDGTSFMHLAAKAKSIELLDFFIGKGLNYNIQDSDGRTPLMILIQQKIPIIKIWEYIIKKNDVDINIQDKKGISFLF